MDSDSVSGRSTMVGLLAIVCIWVTAGIVVPSLNVLRGFSPEELLLSRGVFLVIAAYGIGRGDVWRIDRPAFWASPILALACLGLYRAVRVWAVNPTIVIITLTPLVNVAIAWYRGRRVSRVVLMSMILVISGVVLALEPWTNPFSTEGLCWSLTSALSAGLTFELWSQSRSSKSGKCFWSALWVVLISLAALGFYGSREIVRYPLMQSVAILLMVGLIHGVAYFYANVIAFARLPVTEASILVQGETPIVIIAAYFIANETLDAGQWIGVAIALVGTAILSVWVNKTQQG